MQIEITTAAAPKLNKANARDVGMCRRHLACGDIQAYANGMAGIHRSSSRAQQAEIEAAIIADDMQGAFYRHPSNGCMMAYSVECAA
jgi:hypothetical protein